MASQGKFLDRLESARPGEDKNPATRSRSLMLRAAYDDLLREREATELRLKIVKEELNKLDILKEEKEKVRQIIAQAAAAEIFFKEEE